MPQGVQWQVNSLQIPNLNSHGALGLMGHRHVLNEKVGYISQFTFHHCPSQREGAVVFNCDQILIIKHVANDAIGSRTENHW